MTPKENIAIYLDRHVNIRNNTIIVENSELLDRALVGEGILLVYAGWSGSAISNFAQTLIVLEDISYKGDIVIIDIDVMAPDFQEKTFGALCHGWAEAFLFKGGQIDSKFLGRNSYSKVKAYFGNLN